VNAFDAAAPTSRLIARDGRHRGRCGAPDTEAEALIGTQLGTRLEKTARYWGGRTGPTVSKTSNKTGCNCTSANSSASQKQMSLIGRADEIIE